MQSPFIYGNKAVSKAWKATRANLTSDLTDEQQLRNVVEFWSHAPLRSMWLDWDQPQGWLDAWQLIHSNDYDESSVGLGMFYTLLLGADGRWNDQRLKLILLRDHSRHVQRLVLEVDRQWYLNLEYNSITDIQALSTGVTVQQRYAYNGKEHVVMDGIRDQSETIKTRDVGVAY